MSDQLPEPALQAITNEEESLRQVYDALLEQRKRGSARFSIERDRARDLTSNLVAATRDEDKQALASDEAVSHALRDLKQGELETIEKLIERPYFARIKLKEELRGTQREIEYKIGHAANTECRIIDWRKAPISKLYYEYREGDEYSEEIQGQERLGQVLLRHTVEITRDTLKKLSCRVGQFEKKSTGWTQVGEGGTSVASREAGALPSILALITPEQFHTISEAHDTAVLIQGIAGSGKTTVALHRLAWLLHKENGELKADECQVIVFNRALKSYVSHTLPLIGADGVKVLTWYEWAGELIKKLLPKFSITEISAPSSIERLKRSHALYRAIEELVAQKRTGLINKISELLPWSELPSSVVQLFEKSKNAKIAPLLLIDDLIDAIKKAKESVPAQNSSTQALNTCKNALEQLRVSLCDYHADLVTLFASPESLLKHDTSKLLDRELIKAAHQRTIQNGENQILEHTDLGIILRLAQLTCGSPVQLLKHIVLDEVQEFSSIELAAILGSVDAVQHSTLVGDTAQETSFERAFPGWDSLRREWGLLDDETRFITLSLSHRSTIQIMRLADHVLGQNRTERGREGRVPLWLRCRTESAATEQAISWLSKVRERFPSTVSAVICESKQQARFILGLLAPTFGAAARLGEDDSFAFDCGIIVTDVRQTKGLEFDSVLIWNPTVNTYPDNTLGRNLLYTAITRAANLLTIISYGKTSTLLPQFNSKLVRGMELES